MYGLQIPVKIISIAQQASENGSSGFNSVPDFLWFFSVLILYYTFNFSFIKSSGLLTIYCLSYI